jgi:hypothetical protein
MLDRRVLIDFVRSIKAALEAGEARKVMVDNWHWEEASARTLTLKLIDELVDKSVADASDDQPDFFGIAPGAPKPEYVILESPARQAAHATRDRSRDKPLSLILK